MANSVHVIGLWHHHCPFLSLLSSLAFVYSAPGHMFDASEFIYGKYIGILPQLICIKELGIWLIYGILEAYLPMTHIEAIDFLIDVCSRVGYICRLQ